ncbi:hypothetical protein ASG63_07720 [Methylobacterium sp. Leaf94]|nr:hypothetical protein ASG63_07720 [Methylobacterium sp. Leaf94]
MARGPCGVSARRSLEIRGNDLVGDVLTRPGFAHADPDAAADQPLQVLGRQVGSALGVVEPAPAIPFELADGEGFVLGVISTARRRPPPTWDRSYLE